MKKVEMFFEKERYSVRLSNGEAYIFPRKGRSEEEIIEAWSYNNNSKKAITTKWLVENNACRKGVEWFSKQTETDGIEVIRKLMEENRHAWANWLTARLLTPEQQVRYAVFAAEQATQIWIKAKEYIGDTAAANYAAEDAAAVANAVANAAAYAADAYAAYTAAHAAAYTAAYAAEYAAQAAAYAAAANAAAGIAAGIAAKKRQYTTTINYGLDLLRDCQITI